MKYGKAYKSRGYWWCCGCRTADAEQVPEEVQANIANSIARVCCRKCGVRLA